MVSDFRRSLFEVEIGDRMNNTPFDLGGVFNIDDYSLKFEAYLDTIRKKVFALEEETTLREVLAYLRNKGYTVIEPTKHEEEA